MDDALRALVVALVALPLGAILGMLFVPDPTSTLAYALAALAAVAIGGFLYRSNWLRGA